MMESRGRQTVSVVLTTEGEPEMLEGCLASVEWADEVVVVDRSPGEETENMCRRFANCRVIKHRAADINADMNVGFDAAAGDWMLRIDADERITPELAAEVQQVLEAPPGEVTGYLFWERPMVLGRELRHGYGTRHYRRAMWRRGKARYAVATSHEDLTTDGEWRQSTHGYIHLNYPTFGTYLRKTRHWTTRDVARADLRNGPPGIVEMAREPARAFYLYYLKLNGYRDGWVGLLDAAMRGYYQLVYRIRLRRRWSQERSLGLNTSG